MSASGFKSGGVYVIAGGAGGLGRTLSTYLARRYGARVAWLGRRAEDASIAAARAEVTAAGGEVRYLQADLLHAAEVSAALREVAQTWGRIDGVVHSAIVLRDRGLERMQESDFLAVLDPKTEGTANLARAAAENGAGWLLVFSSVVAFFNGAGQSNYNAGSVFTDEYARWTERKFGLPVRVINWGYWGEVGVVATERYRREMTARGIHSISGEEGMGVVERVLAGVVPQVMYFKANAGALAEMGVTPGKRVVPQKAHRAPSLADLRRELASSGDAKLTADAREVARQLEGMRLLEGLGLAALGAVLRRNGALDTQGAWRGLAPARDALGVLPRFERLFAAVADLAGKASRDALNADAVALQRSLAETHPDIDGLVALLLTCTEALPDVLSGRRAGTDVVFPGGSLRLVERIYKGTVISDHFNRMAAWAIERTVARRLAELPAGQKVRVLEIGAGTGSTSEFVAAALEPHAARVEYVFSDVSAGFRRQFDRVFAERYPFMRFAVVDLDRSLDEQGLEIGSFDVVVAANALHVAKNLHAGLQLVKALLAGNGLLALIEVERVAVFNSLTYGLLDGWWHANDAARRLPNSPLLSRTGWARVLAEEGFNHAGSAELWRGETTGYLQTLLLAESDGRWQREEATKTVPTTSHAKGENVGDMTSNGSTGSHVPVLPPTADASNSTKSPGVVESQSHAGKNGANGINGVNGVHGSNGNHESNGTHAPVLKASIGADRTARVTAKVRGVLKRVFRLEDADLTADTAFDRLGVDSIVAVEVVEALNRELGITLRSVDLFNYTTVGSLLQRILDAHQPVLEAEATPVQVAIAPQQKIEAEAGKVAEKPARNSERAGAIAVVGMSIRAPGAENIDEFWRNLASGRDSVVEVPVARWAGEDYFSEDRRRTDRSYSKHAGLMADIAGFDPLFFNISGHEAELMDPQQRLFLMEAWKALEDAGLPQRKLNGVKCGVFAGSAFGDYDRVLNAGGRDTESFAFTGTAPAILPSRIAYWLNLKGPTFAIDTACSSSGVAINLACESLQLGTSDLAIAGGVSALSTARFHILASQTGMLSPTGKCRTFGAAADGFVPAEAVAVLVLKRLEDAERDGDRIHGVILGSAINQDGRTVGITAPNGPSQTALEVGLYQKLKLNPETIGYVECHGTGTKIGDPIEIGALTEAFRTWTTRRQFCAVGSVKANVGHTLIAAAGTSVIKVLLAMKHRQLPPTLHCQPENPQLEFAQSPFFPNTELREWRSESGPRRAAVSSFGFSGTNAHFVIEEAPVRATIRSEADGRPWLFALSAKAEISLRKRAGELANWLEGADGQSASLAAVAWTLGAGRTHFERRLAVVASSKSDLIAALRAWVRGDAAVTSSSTGLPLWKVGVVGRGAVAKVELPASLTTREDLIRLAEQYVAGAEPSWESLVPAAARAIVSVPTYAFALERYWVERRRTAALPIETVPIASAPAEQPIAKTESMVAAGAGAVPPDALLFAPEWRAMAPVKSETLRGRWLVVGDDGWLAQGIAARGTDVSVSTLGVREAAMALGTNGFVGGLPDAIVFRWTSEAPTLGDALRDGVEVVHATMRAVLRAQPKRELRFVVIVPPDTPELAALAAYLEVAVQEQPRVRVRCVEATGRDEAIFAELAATDGCREVRLAQGTRYAKGLRAVPVASAEREGVAFRQGGTCLITGGAGGLGWIFSQHLARTYRSRLVWLGRSAETEAARKRCAEIAALGGEAIYVQADVRRPDEVARAVATAKARFGAVHAVIHAAGVFRNRFILQKEIGELREVVVPKAFGAVHLDTALAGEPLESFVLCSSVAAAVPEAGQGDYAFANRFLDEFAARRERLRAAGLRAGRTVSINWQMWREGGMVVGSGGAADLAAAAEHARETERISGLPALEAAEGVSLLELAASSAGVTQTVSSGIFGRGSTQVLQQRAERVYGFVATTASEAAAGPVQAARTETAGAALPKVREYVRALMSEVLKIAADRLEETTPFTEYGVDSILVLKFNTRVSQDLPEASKTLLFEFPNMLALSEHLAAAHSRELAVLLGGETPAQSVAAAPEVTAAKPVETILAAADTSQPTPVSVEYPGATATNKPSPSTDDDIAIIGVAGRFPEAEDLEAFWRNLLAGKDCIGPVPRERWDAEALFAAEQGKAGKAYCKWGGFVSGVEEFDASFFSIPPVEAEIMDPQQRLFLQAAWHALENAGYARSQLAKWRLGEAQANIGVFAGMTHNCYQLAGVLRNEQTPTRVDHSGEWTLANRVSYFFNFSGPSFPVDTACSASLSAVHLACESLKRGECVTALAGGVNLHVHPSKYINACSLGMLSPTGKCRTFGEGADGYVPGEGVGALVLKPLSAALRDGDFVHGVIKATAVNHGGRTNGFSVPNPAAQAAVVAAALAKGGIDPRTVTCIEAHGTGTELGDPIEVDGLKRAFTRGGEIAAGEAWCSLGSVKSNIGHLEAAAGIAGIAKVLLQMRHRTLAPTLHAAKANTHIDFSRGPFSVQHTAAEWRRPLLDGREWPRRAGVSSFGAGGSNAHIIIEEFVDPRSQPLCAGTQNTPTPVASELIVLSARSELALRAVATKLQRWVQESACAGAWTLRDIAYTLQVGREAMSERLAFVATSVAELSERLSTWFGGDASKVWRGRVSKASSAVALTSTLEEIARAWVAGAEVDWRALSGASSARLVPLPGYTFEKKRYWYGSFGDATAKAEASAPVAKTLPQPSVSVSVAAPVEVKHWRDAGLVFSAHPEVTLEIDADGVALVRMQDRAHRNMFTAAILEGLMQCFTAIDANDAVKAVIVTGVDNVFAMGGTRDELLTLSEQVRTFASLEFVFKGFLQCRVPVIAAIQGHAQGGGLVFGLYADVVVMAEEGMYSAVFTKYGFTPGLGATFILGDKLGDGLATEMMMTAATYRGSELQQRGAGVTFRPAADVMATALGIAREMAQKPTQTLRTLKHGLAQRKLARLPAVIADEVRMHGETFGQAEVKERIRHYIKEGVQEAESATTPKSAVSVSHSAPVRLSPLPKAEATVASVPIVPSAPTKTEIAATAANGPTLADIRATMRGNLCEKLHLDAATFDGQQTFRDLGLDSILGVEFIHGVNRAFGLRLDASIVYDFVNLDALSEHVAKLLAATPGTAKPATSEPQPLPLAASKSETLPEPESKQAASAIVAPEAENIGVRKLATPALPRADDAPRTRGPIKLTTLTPARAQPLEATREAAVVSRPVAAATDQTPAKAPDDDQIAIIGMACRLPGARDLTAYWRNLAGGVDSVIEVPGERWDIGSFYSADPTAEGKTYCRKGGFIDEVDRFDPLFFNLSHAEAEVMDPQQRIFLEEAWRALEHAGYQAKELSGVSCGVFVGAGTGDYGAIVRRASPALAQSAFAGMGLTPSILAARISYFLNLKGPSVAIDTACSSSLVALHQACRSIQAGDCTMALVGGVSLILEPDQLVTTSKMQMLSPRGQCRSFDDGADGIALSEGVAVVVVKSLQAALADGDRVLAVVRASGINQDGKTNGITAPSAVSQAELERAVYRRANVNPADFGMVEAHGTGTLLGDPVEVRGLTEAFRTFTDKTGYCALGSVKSNIGHTSFAAGIAGVIKTVLCFEHGQIPPSLNFTAPNRHIDFARSPFFVNTALRAWPATAGRPRLAAVSSFGYSGTNAHTVLSDFVQAPATVKRTPLPPKIFARDRCWVATPPASIAPTRDENNQRGAAASDLSVEVSRLGGDDVRLREHRVRGESWVAGSVLLERVLSVASAKLASADDGLAVERLKWTRPLVAQSAAGMELSIELSAAAADSTCVVTLRSGEVVGAEGRVQSVVAWMDDELVDISALLARGGQRMEAAEFYAGMARGGLDYGAAYRLIEEVTFAQGHALSRIKRWSGTDRAVAFSLALEALLQTPAVLSRGAAVPLEVRGVTTAPVAQILAESTWLGRAERIRNDATTETFRLALVAEDGRVLARVAEFVVRSMSDDAPQPSETEEPVYLRSEWGERELVGTGGALHGAVLVLDDAAEFTSRLMAAAPAAKVVRSAVDASALARVVAELKPSFIIHRGLPAGAGRDAALHRGFDAMLAVSQALLRGGINRAVRGLCLLADETPAATALGAVAKTIAQEQPLLRWKTLFGSDDVATVVAELLAQDDAVEIRYRGGRRLVAEPAEVRPTVAGNLPIKRGGTYLISGGAGGLGLIFARYLRERWDANLVLLGRSARVDVTKRVSEALGDDTRWLYCAGDVAQTADAVRAVSEARARFGAINGVLHTAGVLADGFLLKRDLATTRRVLMPKIDGAHALDSATAAEPLEFFVNFSSLAGLFGNVGQCDYAFANAYLDAFALEREQRRAAGERRGKSVSIQWPLWRGGGMDVASEVLAVKAQGVRPIDAGVGIQIFETALRASETVLAGGLRPRAIEAQAYDVRQNAAAKQAVQPVVAQDTVTSVTEASPARALAFLKTRFAELTKIPVERLDGREPLERYGIDSLLVISFTRLLEKDFGPLSKTLLFEHQTLDALAAHFAEQHGARLRELSPEGTPPPSSETLPNNQPREGLASVSVASKPGNAPAAESPDRDAIAIIGLAGRYPEAGDINAFWRNLAAGRDCISEVPAERWKLADVFGARGEPGKTYNRWGGFLTDVDKFDAGFFRIPPREAETMDPQERLFLETAWRTVEDAGYARLELRQRAVGVFVGVMYSQYQLLGLERAGEGKLLTLSASYASIANRVSYFFDWSGPSLAVDSMCSSSLTAIHLACDSLRKGESELALAGGVNVSLHPAKDIGLAQGGFAASDGRCKSFGVGGDGYVPGEGVGAVLLKPLAKALADGDHVYGVIRATAVNHGGKTNGYTVPNPKAQTAVVSAALQAAGVAPGTISYVETHGTGTSLGDPIEIAALTRAWGAVGARCAIGSVKSNIGHLEAAAGMAGLTKVLLQLRHQQLVPSLHSATLNPHIDFAATPFVVQQSCSPWLAVSEGVGPAVRRAGISSFGAGGANAHLVVEECATAQRVERTVARTARQLLVFSASNRERLVEAVQSWRTWIVETGVARLPELADAAFTLQAGREAFDERLAFTAADWREVDELLAAFLENRKIGDWQAGSARATRVGAATLVEGDEGREFVAGLARARNFGALARWWIAGAEVDWRALWHGEDTRRVSLPGYVFARERHWVPEVPWTVGAARSQTAELHPLLQENVSTLAGIEFASRISADAVILRDHVVGGRYLLPGAATLEMALEAARRALGTDSLTLKDVAWLRPIASDGAAIDLRVTVRAKTSGRAGIEISAGAEPCMSAVAEAVGAPATRHVDLAEVAARCGEVVAVAESYAAFATAGLEYGPAFRGVRDLRRASSGCEVLAQLELPAAWGGAKYHLHPGLVDAAFQALAGAAQSGAAGLPFAVRSVECFAALPSRCLAWGRRVEVDGGSRFDLTLCTEEGTVLAEISGLATRAAAGASKAELLAFRPLWTAAPLTTDLHGAAMPRSVLLFDERTELEAALVAVGISVRRVVAGEAFWTAGNVTSVRAESAEDLAKLIADARPKSIVHAWAVSARAGDQFARGVGSVHVLTQALAKAADRKQVTCLFVYPSDRAEFAAVAGYAKTAQIEHPMIAWRVVGMPGANERSAETSRAMLAELAEGAAGALEARYSSNGVREVSSVVEANLPVVASDLSGTRDSVFLISGGAGGLGLIIAEHVVRAWKGRVMLAGRSELSVDKRTALSAFGERVAYVRADVSTREGAAAAVAATKTTFGKITGVIHAAGCLRDGLIWKKRREDFEAVLAPKVDGAKALDAATHSEALDWFILFSSTAGLLGSAGQADYAYANAFLDAFAHRREAQRVGGERSGRTLALNWPLWSDGGMGGGESASKAAAFGLEVLDRASGLALLDRALASGETQLLPCKARRAVLTARLTELAARKSAELKTVAAADAPKLPVSRTTSVEVADSRALVPTKKAVVAHLIRVFCELTKLPAAQVHADEPIENYGLDSIMVTTFAQMLERDLGELSKTLLFEYPTLEALADYLLKAHAEALARVLNISNTSARSVAAEPQVASVSALAREASRVETVSAVPEKVAEKLPTVSGDAIAIIGLAGRYPQADTLAEFWANLAAGKDCIETVPPERWDANAYYDPDPMKAGRTSNRWGGFLRAVDRFDPLFFNLSPREAQFMDPQERLFLETVWHALEDAGCTRTALSDKKVGVFAGAMYGQYQLFGVEEQLKGNPVSVSSSFATIANRVSYFFNWRGPSMTVDTMCSSSLTAIHLACESIRRGECELAVAGGVNVTIHPEKDLILSQTGFSTKDGRCRAFGAGGEGYVPGEGVGVVLLKPLAKAIADGDRIQGVVRASAMNHGGRTNGYTVPNSRSQADVVGEALAQAQLDPRTITYIEAHGTGTSLGDPIEVAGLQSAFENALTRGESEAAPADAPWCALGSVKSNIGHCESAAGIASVTKVLLQFRHGKIAPSLHAAELNPNIKFKDTFFRVQQELGAWKRLERDGAQLPRRAGVSSFGAGGANVHLVLEEYPTFSPSGVSVGNSTDAGANQPVLLVLSAKNEARLRELAGNVARFLAVRIDPASNGDGVPAEARSRYLRDVAWTLQTGREALEERAVWSVREIADAVHLLGSFARGEAAENVIRGNAKRIADDVAQLKDAGALDARIQELAKAGDHAGVAKLWVAGARVEWAEIWQGSSASRVALPGYPFARLRCWVPGRDERLAAQSIVNEAVSSLPVATPDGKSAGDAGEWTTPRPAQVGLSIMFFSDSSQVGAGNRYQLVMEAAQFADRHGFEAVWTPERHFHPFGGIYSSPATLMGALAATTRRLRLRAGSVVLPLEDPLRVAEAWSVVDNLSGGRVDVGFASGWNPNDFALAPDVFPKLRDVWLQRIPEVQCLWRGEGLERRNGKGETVTLKIYPEPCQKELPVWLTVSRRVESFEDAGRGGYNVLTMLQGSTLDQLGEKIARYREARRQAGFDPASGRVTLMLHTFVDPDEARARELVRKPFTEYIRSSLDAHMSAIEGGKRISAEDLQKMAEYSYERYCRQASLIGSPESCLSMVRAARAAGVDEIACLLDFGAENAAILAALPHLSALRQRIEEEMPVNNPTESAVKVPLRSTATPAISGRVVEPDEIRGCFLLREWQESAVESKRGASVRDVLLISPSAGDWESVLATIHPGTGIRRIATGAETLSPVTAADWDTALRRGTRPDRIYFIADDADRTDSPGSEDARVAAGQEAGPVTLHRLVQALVRLEWLKAGLSLRVVTHNAYALEDDALLSPYSAGVVGMASALAKEYPAIDVATVDVCAIELPDAEQMRATVALIAAEPAQRASEKIAIRQGKRWKQRLRLVEQLPAADAGAQFRREGVYLIVGGAGSVGQALSRYLAEHYAARLVWVGRRPADARIAAAIAEVEALGGSVEYVSAQSEDAAAMRVVVARARTRFGALHGALHAALVFQDERLGNLSEAECRAVLDAKTRGSAALFDAVRELELDFLFFLGSAQSLFNEARRGAYAAACCFQDAFVEAARRKVRFPVQVVNWGFWSHGIDPALAPSIAAAGLGMITPEVGIPAIEAILAGRASQVAYLKANDAALARMGVVQAEVQQRREKSVSPPQSLDDRIAASLFN